MQLSQNSNKKILTIDIGATNTRIAIVDNDLKILKSDKFPTPKNNLNLELHKIILKFCDEYNTISGVGVSVAGPVSENHAVMTNIAEKPVISTSDFTHISSHVFLVNDATAAAYGESRHHNVKNLVFITISSGIGVGVIQDGGIVNFKSTAEEIGHICIKSSWELPCGCGETNHWESYASGINIPNFYNAWRKTLGLKPTNKSAGEIYGAADQNEPTARDFVVNKLGHINSYALKIIIGRYKPEVLVLGGPVVLQNIDLFLAGLESNIRENVKIIFPSHDDEICLLGAAAYTLDQG